MAFYLRKNGRTKFYIDQADLDNILEVRLSARQLERRLAVLEDDVLSSTVQINAVVPIYSSPSKIGRYAGMLRGQLNEEVLILRIVDEDPLSESDPTTGSILYVELTREGWTVGDRWYQFDNDSQEEIGTAECCQIYLGTLPVAEEENAAAEA